MAQTRGSLSQITYDTETTFKTDPATPATTILPFISEELRLNRELIASEVITPTRDFKKPALGNHNVSGSINLEINPYMGTIFRHALGSATTTGDGTTTPFNHEIKISSLPISLVIEKEFKDKRTSPAFQRFFKYNGCRVNSFSMGIDPSGIIKGNVAIIGAKETDGATSLDATPTDDGHVPWKASELAAADIKEGGSAIAKVTHFDFTLENALDDDEYVIGGGGERASLPEGKAHVTGTLIALFDAMTLYNKAINSTETSFQVTFKRGDGTGIGAGNETFDIIIPELIYTPNTPVVDGPTGIKVELPFEAYFDNATEGTSLEINLQNTKATI